MELFIKYNLINIIITLIIIILHVLFLKYAKYSINLIGKKNNIKTRRIIYITKLFRILIFLSFIVFISIIWGINYKFLFIFATTFFTIVGIALFATWSILSNLTSSFIIFSTCPFKIDDKIQILDGDNTIEGKILDMTLFNVLLEDNDGNIVTYPNNILLQKAIIKKLNL